MPCRRRDLEDEYVAGRDLRRHASEWARHRPNSSRIRARGYRVEDAARMGGGSVLDRVPSLPAGTAGPGERGLEAGRPGMFNVHYFTMR